MAHQTVAAKKHCFEQEAGYTDPSVSLLFFLVYFCTSGACTCTQHSVRTCSGVRPELGQIVANHVPGRANSKLASRASSAIITRICIFLHEQNTMCKVAAIGIVAATIYRLCPLVSMQ